MKKSYKDLPNTIARKLTGVDRTFFFSDLIRTFATAATLVVFSLLVFYVSDRLWDTPVLVRFLITGFGFAAALVAVFFCCLRQLRWWRNPAAAACLIQKKNTNLGDSLQGMIELAKTCEESSCETSASLCRAAIEQVNQQVENLSFTQAVSLKPLKRATAGFAFAVIAVFGVYVVDAEIFFNSYKRWLMPFDEVARSTFVRLHALPAYLRVPYGEETEMRVRLLDSSRLLPKKIQAFLDNNRMSFPFSGRTATIVLPAVTENQILRLKAVDARQCVRIIPKHRPLLLEMIADIKPPSYLELEPYKVDCSNLRLEVPHGCRYSVSGNISRKIKFAYEDTQEVELQVSGNSFVTAELSGDADSNLSFTWKDIFGLACSEPVLLEVSCLPDMAPLAAIQTNTRGVALLISETLPIRMQATDDFGVKWLGVEYEIAPLADESAATVSKSRILMNGRADATELNTDFVFSPFALNIQPNTKVTLFTTAVDFLPEREAARSQPFSIFVLDPEKHAELLLQQFNQLLPQIEAAAERENENTSATQQLVNLDDLNLSSKETISAIRARRMRENRNAEAVQLIAEDGMKLLQEALKNDLFGVEALVQWADVIDLLQLLAENEMAQIQEKMQEAEREADARRSKLHQSVEKQEYVYTQLRELVKTSEEIAERIQINSFAQRLRILSDSESSIATDLRKLLISNAGLTIDMLAPAEQTKAAELAVSHRKIAKEAALIKNELQHFFIRTRILPYKTIVDEMMAEKMNDALARVTLQIDKNQSAAAGLAVKEWQQNFEKWARELETVYESGKAPKRSSEMNDQEMKLAVGLLRLLELEQLLYLDTQATPEPLEVDAEYARKTRDLTQRQVRLRKSLQDIRSNLAIPDLAPLLDAAGAEMLIAALELDNQRTGIKTLAAESAAIECLSLIFSNKNGDGLGNLSSSAALASMLKSANSSGTGSTGAGSLAGGTGAILEHKNGNAGEHATGTAQESGGAAGVVEPDQLPREFRSRLDAYLKKMEIRDNSRM